MKRLLEKYVAAYSGLPRPVWLLCFALFTNRFGKMVFPFLTLYLTSELAMTESSAGRLLSIYGVGSFVGVYIAGHLISRIGAVRLQILFLLMTVPIFLMMPFLRDWWAWAIAVFVWAFFGEGIRPSNATAIADFTPTELQTRAFGLRRMAVNLGMAFGPAIGGFLATVSFVLLFVVDAATTLVCVSVLILSFGLGRTIRSEAPKPETPSEAHPSPLRDFGFVGFLLLLLGGEIVFFQFGITYPLYLRDHYTFTKPMIGGIYALNTIIIVAFEMVMLDAVANRFSKVKMVGLGTFLFCIGFGMLPLGSTWWFVAISMLFITAGEMLSLPIASGWVAERSRGKNTPMYMSWFTLTFSTTAVLAPLIGGALYEYDARVLWGGCAVVGTFVMVGYFFLASRLDKPASYQETEKN